MIDRSVDLVTPFVTQKSYEGQIDEQFGMHANATCIGEQYLSSEFKGLEPKLIRQSFDAETDFIFK